MNSLVLQNVERRRGPAVVTPLGWFVVLCFAAVAIGTTAAFAT
jgi:hypothetical protein